MAKKKYEKELDPVDQELLNILQNEFPLTSRPFLKIAEKVDLSEKEVMERIRELKNIYIRRIGGIFNSRKLGYVSTLLAARVEENYYYEVADKINQFRGVTHNYRRNHDYNMWFTLSCRSRQHLNKIIKNIENFRGVIRLRKFPVKKSFKVKVDLEMNSRKKEDQNDY